jgi:hypothetical protein
MGAVSEALADFDDSVHEEVSNVGETIQNTGQAVIDTAVTPVVRAVQNTYDAFEKDPVGTSIKIAAAVSGDPYYIMAANTSVNVAQGQPLDEALENAGKATATTVLAQEAGKYAVNEFGTPTAEPIVDIEAGPTPTIEATPPAPPVISNKDISSAAQGATRAAIKGEDPITGAVSGVASSNISSGINAGTSAASKEISDADFEKWSQEQAQNSYDNAPSPTELEVMAADNTVAVPPATTTTETGPGYYNEATGEFVSDPNGGLQNPLDNTSGTNLDSMKDYKYDIATNTWTSPDGEVISLNDLSNTRTPLDTESVLPPSSVPEPEAYNPLNVKPALDYAAKAALQKAAADKAAADRAAAVKAAQANAGQTTQSNNLLGLLALLDTKAPQAPVQNNPNDIKYFYDIMGSDILPPTVPKTEKPVFNYAEGGTIEDLIRMLRS